MPGPLNLNPQFALAQQAISSLQLNFGPLSAAIGALAETMKGLTSILGNTGNSLAAFGQSIAGIVAKANPAIVQQFELVMNDVMGVLGQALAPVLQVVTQLVRTFADAIADFAPELGSVLATILKDLAPLFQIFFEALTQVGHAIADVLRFLEPFIRIAVEGIKTVFEWIGKAIRFILDLIGIELSSGEITKGKSVGAGVRQASISSVEDVIRKAQVSAFQLGNAAGPNYAEMTARSADATVIALNRMNDFLKNSWLGKAYVTVKNLVEGVGEGLGDLAYGATTNGYETRLKTGIESMDQADRIADVRNQRRGAISGSLGLLGPAALAALDASARARMKRAAPPDGGGTVKAES